MRVRPKPNLSLSLSLSPLPNGRVRGALKRINVDYTQIDIFLFQKNFSCCCCCFILRAAWGRVLNARLCMVSIAFVVVVVARTLVVVVVVVLVQLQMTKQRDAV